MTPAFLPAAAFPLDDQRKKDISLGQLLCMTAGYHGEGAAPGVRAGGEVVKLRPVAMSTFQPPRDAELGFAKQTTPAVKRLNTASEFLNRNRSGWSVAGTSRTSSSEQRRFLQKPKPTWTTPSCCRMQR